MYYDLAKKEEVKIDIRNTVYAQQQYCIDKARSTMYKKWYYELSLNFSHNKKFRQRDIHIGEVDKMLVRMKFLLWEKLGLSSY